MLSAYSPAEVIKNSMKRRFCTAAKNNSDAFSYIVLIFPDTCSLLWQYWKCINSAPLLVALLYNLFIWTAVLNGLQVVEMDSLSLENGS